MTTRHHTRT